MPPASMEEAFFAQTATAEVRFCRSGVGWWLPDYLTSRATKTNKRIRWPIYINDLTPPIPPPPQEIAAKREEREQEAIRVKHGAKLEEWATDPTTKKPRNVRTLLSTMHTVLWEGAVKFGVVCVMCACGWGGLRTNQPINLPTYKTGCSWKAVSLGDLMMPDRVKFHYRKAMLVLHPDKNVNGSAEQRFVSEKIFTSVNEAYNIFSAQELK